MCVAVYVCELASEGLNRLVVHRILLTVGKLFFFFTNVMFYVGCSEVSQFLVPFLHEHQPLNTLKNCVQNSSAAVAQHILLKTVEKDICNL